MATTTALNPQINPANRKIGLIAGWGSYPVCIARSLVEQGYEVHCTAIKDHADPILADICHQHRVFGMGRMGRASQILSPRRRFAGNDGGENLQDVVVPAEVELN